MLDTKTGKVTDVREVGALPEDIVALSPDNKYLPPRWWAMAQVPR